MTKGVVVIAGPTASGKSQVALELADRLAEFGGARIINADSMQVYRELQIVTARPSAADEVRTPHRLYGVLSALDICSAGRWRALAVAEIERAHAEGAVPVVVGGTGLYLNVLLRGIAPVPAIPAEVRAAARDRLRDLGPEAFRAELGRLDGEAAANIGAQDAQRLIRAWEVVTATGATLRSWQRRAPDNPLTVPAARVLVMPVRADVYANCDARVVRMVAEGVKEEISAFEALAPGDDLPATRAVGVPEFRRWVHGEIPESEAVAEVQQASRNYAKRQFTWFRTQAADWQAFAPLGGGRVAQYSESLADQIFPFIRRFLLTT